MAEPLISILLPVRDAATTLPAALSSIQRQSEPRFECIAVDDGSSDHSLEVLRARALADRRFRVLATEGRGIVGALTAGLELCRGRYVARMDADDLMHRARLERQLTLLEKDDSLAGAGCHVRLFPRRPLTAGRLAYEGWLCSLRTPEDVAREAYVECPLAHPTFFLRREVLSVHGYSDRGWPEDYDSVLRLLARGEGLGVVPEPLLFWRDGPARLSRTGQSYLQGRFTACKAYYLAHNFLAQHSRYVLWGYGDTGRALSRELRALGKEISNIVQLHPGRLGQRIFGASVVPPRALDELRGLPIIVSVAGPDARALIRAELSRMAFVESRDYVCAA